MGFNTEKYWDELSNLCQEIIWEIEKVLTKQPDKTLDISKAKITIDDNGSYVESLHLSNDDYDVICTLKNKETYNLCECDIFDILLVAEAINSLED